MFVLTSVSTNMYDNIEIQEHTHIYLDVQTHTHIIYLDLNLCRNPRNGALAVQLSGHEFSFDRTVTMQLSTGQDCIIEVYCKTFSKD